MSHSFIFWIVIILSKCQASLKLRVDNIYTLKSGVLKSPSFYVGPKHLRRVIHISSRRKSRELNDLRHTHRDLDSKISLLDVPKTVFLHQELKQLKKEKLRVKDKIVSLLREIDVERESREVLTLGSGGFGKVIFAEAVDSGKEVAVKIASLDDFVELWKEYQVLQKLDQRGFPHVFYFGKQDILDMGPHVVLVMDVLGPSLERLLLSTTLGVKGFTSSTVSKIALQLLQRLESLSTHNIIHGDIQPGNFLMGKNSHDNGLVHLIDFGLCSVPHLPNPPSLITSSSSKSPGMHSKESSIHSTNHHLEAHIFNNQADNNIKNSQGITNPIISSHADVIRGTLGFASSRVLDGNNATYRDDLESLAFSLGYLLQGQLPWNNIDLDLNLQEEMKGITLNIRIDKMIQLMARRQESCTAEELCGTFRETMAGEIISVILLHARSLSASDKPDFTYLQSKMKEIVSRFRGEMEGSKYDWENEGISWSTIDGTIVHKGYL